MSTSSTGNEKGQDGPGSLQLKLLRPTVAEYLQHLSFHEKVKDPHSEKLCKLVWDAFISMNDESRNYLLKGLIERSSENQLEYMKIHMQYIKHQSNMTNTQSIMKYNSASSHPKTSEQPKSKKKA